MHSIVFESAFNYLYKPICSADKTGYIRQIFPLYLIKLKHIECDWRALIDESQPSVIHLCIDFNYKDCEIWISTRLNNKVLSVCLSGYDVMWFYRLTPSDVGGGTTCIMRYWENKRWDPSWTSLNMSGENRAWPCMETVPVDRMTDKKTWLKMLPSHNFYWQAIMKMHLPKIK